MVLSSGRIQASRTLHQRSTALASYHIQPFNTSIHMKGFHSHLHSATPATESFAKYNKPKYFEVRNAATGR
ncbi:hypothetical protein I7I53_02620 [Histoplasma capsulatum var. duboisii H88]|uniref:Uncharacterized protein n=1 Tax=Ajellomyces capsulatus (strain H88) TaxID=544711 RepID=A0A8A1LS93_AJEC8|nr:hypothetical protein I7I53_02620 [Histoplasma capsulatum var. duboisii H88]